MRLLVAMEMYFGTCVLDIRNEPPPQECNSFAKVLGGYPMRKYRSYVTQKRKKKKTRGKQKQQGRDSQEEDQRNTKSTSRLDPEDENAKGVRRFRECWQEFVSVYNCLPSLVTLATLQRLADSSDQKPNESVRWREAFAGHGVTPDREARIDLTDMVDVGDQMWHKVAGVREKKARDFILQDDTGRRSRGVRC